jgi:hypothetical protein
LLLYLQDAAPFSVPEHLLLFLRYIQLESSIFEISGEKNNSTIYNTLLFGMKNGIFSFSASSL